MPEQHLGVEPRPTDIFVGVMGMTGAGKSTFISLCTGEDVAVGHDLQACTQQVGVYKCKWSSSCDIYLLDTPGFDDTNRSDTEVLKDIAAWLTKSYKLNLELSGILYLHRITDPRMQGSAKKNLFMLKKLCGADGLKNVLLVSTMWEVVDENTGSSREQELAGTEEFWGILIRSGARVKRHDNGRESALRLLKELVQNKKMAMSIQKEMVTEGKTLDQTQAGIELESELQKQREQFKRELVEVQEMVLEAMEARDEESSEALRQHQADTQRKLDKIMREREDLKVTMETMHAEKFATLEKKHQEQKEEIEEMQKEEMRHRGTLEQELKAQMELLTQRLEESKSPGQDLEGRPASRPQTPGVSSVPSPCRIRKGSSVALSGSRFCVLGLGWNTNSTPPGLTANDESKYFDLGTNASWSKYVALGTNDSWYHHYHVNGRCWTVMSHNLALEYPGIETWIAKEGAFGCPIHVSLGPSGMRHVRLHNGKWTCSLPRSVRAQVDDSVWRVWLGYKRKYIVEKNSGVLVWSLGSHYNRLARRLFELEKDGVEVKELAMNISEPESFIVVSTGGVYSSKLGDISDLRRSPPSVNERR